MKTYDGRVLLTSTPDGLEFAPSNRCLGGWGKAGPVWSWEGGVKRNITVPVGIPSPVVQYVACHYTNYTSLILRFY
jgi:hypothetical protein